MRKVLGFLLFAGALSVPETGRGGATPSARVDCEARENGKPASASFRVQRDSTQIVKGSCGRAVEVPPGSYDVVVVLDGVADGAERRQAVEARVDQLTKVQASFETGEILVEVTREGRRGVGTVKLLRAGQVLATLSAGVASRVSVGTYTVEIESRGTRRAFDAVTVSRGERRTLSADFSSNGAQASP
jgi:hypothetical protein